MWATSPRLSGYDQHTSLNSTVYLDSDEWTCRAATAKEEAMSLIEGGFQYVTTIEGIQLFKKRK